MERESTGQNTVGVGVEKPNVNSIRLLETSNKINPKLEYDLSGTNETMDVKFVFQEQQRNELKFAVVKNQAAVRAMDFEHQKTSNYLSVVVARPIGIILTYF